MEEGGPPAASRPALPYLPALDGLRGAAVIAVLLFHSNFGWARGGYLGVSAFFTLSGFLITSLLLAERTANGAIALKRFWVRRARRLLPAAWLTLVGTALLVFVAGNHHDVTQFRFDGLFALFQLANWRDVYTLSHQSYADVVATSPSPVLHYWSLAIEEQFYVIFPGLFVVLYALVRGSRRTLALCFGALAAVSVALLLPLYTPHADTSRVYFGTDTRAAELLVGVILAIVVSGRVLPRVWSRLVAAGGVGSMLVLAVAWSRVRQSNPALYRGGLLAHALVTAVLILAAREPGPASSALSFTPLRALGRISYGVYLYHFPIFWWLDADRTGLATAPLFVVRVVVTLAVASASYRWLELPIRRGHRVQGRRVRVAIVVAPLTVAAIVLVATVAPPRATTVFAAVAQQQPDSPFDRFGVPAPPPSTVATAGSAPSTVPTRPMRRILVVGDSVAQTLGRGLERWGPAHGIAVWNIGRKYCGMGLGASRVVGTVEQPPSPACEEWPLLFPAAVRAFHPDVVVVSTYIWDAMPHRLPAWKEFETPKDAEYERWLEHDYVLANDLLAAQGATVAWLSMPCDEGTHLDSNQMAMNRIITTAVRQRPHTARLVDLQPVLCGPHDSPLHHTRSDDGFHFTDRGSDVFANWLGPRLAAVRSQPTN